MAPVCSCCAGHRALTRHPVWRAEGKRRGGTGAKPVGMSRAMRWSEEGSPYFHPGSALWPWILGARPSVSDDVLTKDRFGMSRKARLRRPPGFPRISSPASAS